MRGIQNESVVKKIWWVTRKIWRIYDVFRRKGMSSHILMFHDISIDNEIEYSVSIKTFKKIIEWHIHNEYNFISIEKITNRRRIGKRKCVVTFDDGKSNFMKIYPYLKGKHIPFCLYIISSKIGKDGYLDETQLRMLSKDYLCTIGSHTLTHTRTRFLDDCSLEYELVKSKKDIEAIINKEVDHFAYPNGHFVACSVFDEKFVKNAGYESAVRTNQTSIGRFYNRYRLPRFDASRKDILRIL